MLRDRAMSHYQARSLFGGGHWHSGRRNGLSIDRQTVMDRGVGVTIGRRGVSVIANGLRVKEVEGTPLLDTNALKAVIRLLRLAQFFIVLSCTIAVGTNLSQFICIGRFTAVSFQVLGHMKTILVLILGFFFFGKEGLNLQVVLGMVLAVVGMVWYGNASSKPGGKERRSYSLPSDRSQKLGAALAEPDELDEKV